MTANYKIYESYIDFCNESIEEAKTEYVKVNFGDKKETESALDYIQRYGQTKSRSGHETIVFMCI